MVNGLRALLSSLWSSTGFGRPELARYAEPLMVDETRRGLQVLALLSFILQLSALGLYDFLGRTPIFHYTYGLLALLSLHILISARFVNEIKVLHLLGMVLLVISALAIVLLAHRAGDFDGGMLASVALLFMAMPLVPWGIREASALIFLIYLLFTVSALSVQGRFDNATLIVLQFLIIAAAVTAALLVTLNLFIRKRDIGVRYELEEARARMEKLSMVDPLTGAWNRRVLEQRTQQILEETSAQGERIHIALLDIDDFKQANDQYGHQYGDAVLRQLVAAISAELGDAGYIVRMGGDEFMLLCPHADLGARIDRAVAKASLDPEVVRWSEQGIHVSRGLVEVELAHTLNLSEIYRRADRRLYEDKAAGPRGQHPRTT